ncbi:hypothetical protein GCM10007916_24260 [Psychromonas marina]|uniref:Uncharacterized protein n=1 Tax=Psychromonas marina TaxID=88364 RepID=A0ABQ6E1N9_9GAMM|nr:hypothetical protein GCM10007916_24260 [Psychromonas marina]
MAPQNNTLSPSSLIDDLYFNTIPNNTILERFPKRVDIQLTASESVNTDPIRVFL